MANYLDTYVDLLYQRQNMGANLNQQNLYSKEDYYELLSPVMQLINEHGDWTLEEMRDYLFKKANIEDLVRDFVYKKEMVSGAVFSYGTANFNETVVVGNQQEVSLVGDKLISDRQKMTEDTIFDIASVTKLFTGLSILKLTQEKVISLNDEVVKYAPEFKYLKGITIFDLITFGAPLQTDKRMDMASSKEEAEEILFNIKPLNISFVRNAYTDMGAMILKYVIEKVSGMRYADFLQENFLKPLKMTDTHVIVPDNKIERVASTNYDVKYYKDGNSVLNTLVQKGTAYDPKARIMGQIQGSLSGHAGLFSSVGDMTSLARGIISGQIISDKYAEMMAKNYTGKKYNENGIDKYTQHFGMMTYSKNPNVKDSEVYPAMSGKSFASAGWTGMQMTVDPINDIHFFLGSNRSHNRVTFIDPIHKDKVITDENGRKTIKLPNGDVKIDATRYAYDKSLVLIDPALKLALQYKMLEDYFDIDLDNKEENTRTI